MHHKEESPSRITNDAKNRADLRQKLETCIDPLNDSNYPDKLVNIVTGHVVAHKAVNVENAAAIGMTQMVELEAQWPESFNETLHKKVVTMAITKKHIKVADKEVYDTEIIYARAMTLQQSREFDTANLMAHELSPYPPSMFDEDGHMKEAKTKSALKNALQVTKSIRGIEADAVFLDGCALFWVAKWPSGGTVQDFLDSFRGDVKNILKKGDVYLTFDR